MVELENHHIANLINNFNKELKKLDSLELTWNNRTEK